MKLLNVLKEEIDKKSLLRKLEEMGFEDESAQQELKHLVGYLKSLPPIIKLYRLITSDDIKNIDLEYPGSHYSMNLRNLLDSHSYLTGMGEKYYLLTIKAPKKLMDIEETLSNNILYPNEQEITLKNNGEGVEIISVKEIEL